MLVSLKDKTALVCGSSQGIGKAIAIQFAKMDANVILSARSEEKLKETLLELHNSGIQIHEIIPADYNNPQNFIDKVKDYLNSGKKIDILVNNTGGPSAGSISEAAPALFIQAFNQHIIMSQLLVQSLIEGMKSRGYGRIINVISISVKQPIENLGVSNTVRGAMASWSKTLSRELAPHGITVNNILPGYTKTQRLISLFENKANALNRSVDDISMEVLKDIPAARFGESEELGYLAGFLASPLSSYITGTSIPIDGGFIKGL